MSLKEASGVKPKAAARCAEPPLAQLATMPAICSLRTNLTCFLTSGPATSSKAFSISLTVTLRPGKFKAKRPCMASRLASKMVIKHLMVLLGEETECDTFSSTGQMDSMPANGSRMMPLKKEEAAPLGLPGRTVTVIKRAARPST